MLNIEQNSQPVILTVAVIHLNKNSVLKKICIKEDRKV